ncbi:MAG: glycerol-3-phosphate dehydrogenase/oxidase [Bacteroidales bacterium]
MKREEMIASIDSLGDKSWDIIIIGGGATGAGIALDAASRGYKTLLLEQSDFSKGTSSRSTKLVHGGVRYMAQGDLLLVIEALKERGIMLRNAPHLTSNQEFIIPVYTVFDVILYTVGLKFYDILSGRLSLGRSYFINRKKTSERLPNIKKEGLRGGIVYHDGQFDDSRMNFELVRMACKLGATALNYCKVTSILKRPDGRIAGVQATDLVSKNQYTLSASVVINATGVFANEVIKLDKSDARSILRPSQGVHLVIDRKFLGGDSAIMIPKTDDGRVLFAIPWHGKVVVGTTDTPLEDVSDEPRALEKEISFILDTAGRYLVKPPSREDVLSVFAGLRPLASDPDNPHSTREISRRHKIVVSKSGLITITGGKWTTYRLMAAETIDRAVKEGLIRGSDCTTDKLLLSADYENRAPDTLSIYGDNAKAVSDSIIGNPGFEKKMHPSLPYTIGEVRWICRNELVVSIEDVLARRTRALFLDAAASIEMASGVASILAEERGHDKAWMEQQINSYINLALNYRL